MHKGRLEAFSDGVIAIIITIMVLELHAPTGVDFEGLRHSLPTLLSYLLSFVFLGIYWNNHHHLFQAAHRVTGGILWANLHLLFWLSLIPFVTSWMGSSGYASLPVAVYGVVLLCCGVAFTIVTQLLIRQHDANSVLASAIGRDYKGKLSLAIYASAIATALFYRWVACGMYVFVALMWLVPDRRIEDELMKPKA